jgi:hypothetical protein
MISSAAHPRWPLRPPSWIWFPSIICPTSESTVYLHLVKIHDIPHHPTLPFHLIPKVTYRSGAYATPGVALVAYKASRFILCRYLGKDHFKYKLRVKQSNNCFSMTLLHVSDAIFNIIDSAS